MFGDCDLCGVENVFYFPHIFILNMKFMETFCLSILPSIVVHPFGKKSNEKSQIVLL